MASSIAPLVRTYFANGTINPYSFVKFDSSSNSKNPKIIQCGAGDRPDGIAQNESTANAGDEVEVAFPGGGAKLKITGTVALSNYLKSDSSGYGIPTTTAGDAYGASAVEGGVSGDVIGVHVIKGEKYSASA